MAKTANGVISELAYSYISYIHCNGYTMNRLLTFVDLISVIIANYLLMHKSRVKFSHFTLSTDVLWIKTPWLARALFPLLMAMEYCDINETSIPTLLPTKFTKWALNGSKIIIYARLIRMRIARGSV